ncbi:TPA: hypothetical protein NIK62_000116 [Vibrio cholerae]|uniref:hypothetical protein n=1 Tax=Vibrio cholerae TaxID=666 RepID=UPI0004E458D1|nr:hypothetical protein [Vibrio cholerae]EMC8696548.1 hypothetical protein [Vibrio cholerae]KFD96721.1 hypothetical protein DN33_196 [Vibrio cholerae]KNA58506.1 hypothetical protein VCV51_032710 [Vibrio cholerae V51]GIB64754.1 hypothetical protein VCSRO141_0618 [Vibrio cholerae]HCF7740776.1 hypothetical protein [Vibrio cholerae]
MPPAPPPPTKPVNQPHSSKSLQKHISTLKAFQKYRTGKDERTFEETDLEPKAITESINFAIETLSKRQKLIDGIKNELLSSVSVLFRPHIEGVFAVIKLKIENGEIFGPKSKD